MSTIESSGELEAFDTLAESIVLDNKDELVVGQIYTKEQVQGRVGTWQPVGDGAWLYEGILYDREEDSPEIEQK